MDERLSAAAEFFPRVAVGADIGANHGYLACRLLSHGKAQRMWLTDLSADALEQARRNVQAQGLTDRARFAVGDGFTVLPERVDAAAILGMGGITAAGILHSAPKDLLPETLVVSSHTEQETVRRALYERGYAITREQVVLSVGRFYVLHLAQQAGQAEVPDERLLFLGPCLVEQNSPVYRAYLERRSGAYRPSRIPEGRKRYEWLREEAARAAADSPVGT